MADLAAIMAETSKSYDNSRKALNDQINAISGDLEAQQGRINSQYAQQAKSLDNQRNYQAQAASMRAANNGGSFGGSAAIADKKYYQQAYVPAVTQMQTNQANDLSSAESQANANRLSLQQTLASLNDEANRYGLQRYDAAVAAEEAQRQFEKQLAEQRRQFDAQLAAQNSWQRYLNQSNNQSNNQTNSRSGTSFADWLNSTDALNTSGWADWMKTSDKVEYLKNLAKRWTSSDPRVHSQIVNGSTYQDYLKWLQG